MYQTKRLESDVTQESLLQQCTLDGQRAKVHKRDENVREREREFFSPHSSAHISESCSCTRLVSTYIVALFQCFRMVPASCSSGGANKNVPPKNCTPLK